jgi:phosphatidylserine decarboxylase
MSFEIEYRGTIARWLPKDPDVIRRFQNELLTQLIKNGVFTRAHDVDQKQLSPVIFEFKKLIEGDAGIFRDFHEMFKQVRPNPDPNQRSVSASPAVVDILTPLTLLIWLDHELCGAPRCSR